MMRFLKKIATWALSFCLVFSLVFVCFEPVDVYADSGSYSSYLDYGLETAQDAYEDLGLTSAVAQYFGMFSLLKTLTSISLENPDAVQMPTNNIGTVGRYFYNGEHKLGTAFSYGGFRFFADSGQGCVIPIFSCPDGQINVGVENLPANGITISTGSANFLIANWSGRMTFTVDSVGTFEDYYCGVSVGSSEVNWQNVNATLSANYIYRSLNSPSSQIIGSSVGFSAPAQGFLPGENVDYINDVMLPYFRNIPEIEPYVPDPYTPDTPYEPIYPTDFVTGIPKDWTIENPPLPTAPYIDFGQGDFDFSKPSEYLEEVVNEAEALDFWWWLTEKTFKKCGVFEYFLAFITLGFAMFALWRWGS